MGTDVVATVIEKLNHKKVHAGDYVFKFGEIGYKYYIILSGKVRVEVPFQDPSGKENA